MTFFKWDKDLLTGIQVIDYQHKRLVNIINDLSEIQKEEDFKEELIEVVVEELKQYAKFHFSTEEKLFEKMEHTKIDDHKKKHRSFEKTLDNLLEKRDQYSEISDELLSFLKSWLSHHILIEDREMIDIHMTEGGLI